MTLKEFEREYENIRLEYEDALDPNSYETTCAQCDATIIGQFSEDGKLATPCAECGSLKTKGCLSSPAGAYGLAMRDPNFE